MGGLGCYTTWLELWVFLCFRVQREGPLLLFLHQCKETFSYHRGLGKGPVSLLMIARGGDSKSLKWAAALSLGRLECGLKSPFLPVGSF